MSEKNQTQLDQITRELEQFGESPLYAYRVENNFHVVPGEGNPDADILFIGEAPGAREAKTGRPFVGASGKMLAELLAEIGLERKDVFITNVVKDRPPDNRDPLPEEIELYTPFLKRQIDIIQPRVIATLGRFAMDYVFEQFDMPQQGRKISQMHGSVLNASASYGEIAVVPLYHPAVALYNRSQKPVLVEDFEVLKPFIS